MFIKNWKRMLIVAGVAAVMLTGCSLLKNEKVSPDSGISSDDYITSIDNSDPYKEYADAIGLIERDNYQVVHFEEETCNTDGSKCLYIQLCGVDHDNVEAGMQDVKSLIDAHNTFVEENPDYFSEDIRIRIELVEVSQYSFARFYDSPYGKEFDEKLGLSHDHKIKYLEYDPQPYAADFLNTTVKLNIPVIEMYYKSLSDTDYKDLELILNMCNDVEAVMAYCNENNDFDYDQFTKIVSEKQPSTAIYKMSYNGSEYEIEKIN